MAVTSYVSTSGAALISAAFRNLEETIKVVFWDVTFVAWTKNRPTTSGSSWDAGTADEGWVQGVTGTGRLKENGSGGPVIGQDVIYQQAPFRLRCEVAAGLDHTMWVVIDGTRLFKVEGVQDRAGDRQHVNAYLSEIFDMPLPVEVAP